MRPCGRCSTCWPWSSARCRWPTLPRWPGCPLSGSTRSLATLIAGRAVAESQRAGELVYEIQHPLIRDVIYQQISGARKRVLHRQVARSLLDGRPARRSRACISPVRPNRVMTRRSGSCSTRCARPNSARRSARSLDLLSELVDILPPTDRRWLDVLEAMYWQAEWVVDHRAEARTRDGRPGAAGYRRAAGGLARRRPARDGQVPPGQLPGMGDRRAAGGRTGLP